MIPWSNLTWSEVWWIISTHSWRLDNTDRSLCNTPSACYSSRVINIKLLCKEWKRCSHETDVCWPVGGNVTRWTRFTREESLLSVHEGFLHNTQEVQLEFKLQWRSTWCIVGHEVKKHLHNISASPINLQIPWLFKHLSNVSFTWNIYSWQMKRYSKESL